MPAREWTLNHEILLEALARENPIEPGESLLAHMERLAILGGFIDPKTATLNPRNAERFQPKPEAPPPPPPPPPRPAIEEKRWLPYKDDNDDMDDLVPPKEEEREREPVPDRGEGPSDRSVGSADCEEPRPERRPRDSHHPQRSAPEREHAPAPAKKKAGPPDIGWI